MKNESYCSWRKHKQRKRKGRTVLQCVGNLLKCMDEWERTFQLWAIWNWTITVRGEPSVCVEANPRFAWRRTLDSLPGEPSLFEKTKVSVWDATICEWGGEPSVCVEANPFFAWRRTLPDAKKNKKAPGSGGWIQKRNFFNYGCTVNALSILSVP